VWTEQLKGWHCQSCQRDRETHSHIRTARTQSGVASNWIGSVRLQQAVLNDNLRDCCPATHIETDTVALSVDGCSAQKILSDKTGRRPIGKCQTDTVLRVKRCKFEQKDAASVGILKLHLGECDGAVLDAAARNQSSDPIRRSCFTISCSTYWREPAFASRRCCAVQPSHRLTGLRFPHSLTLGAALHSDSAAASDLACGSCRLSRS